MVNMVQHHAHTPGGAAEVSPVARLLFRLSFLSGALPPLLAWHAELMPPHRSPQATPSPRFGTACITTEVPEHRIPAPSKWEPLAFHICRMSCTLPPRIRTPLRICLSCTLVSACISCIRPMRPVSYRLSIPQQCNSASHRLQGHVVN